MSLRTMVHSAARYLPLMLVLPWAFAYADAPAPNAGSKDQTACADGSRACQEAAEARVSKARARAAPPERCDQQDARNCDERGDSRRSRDEVSRSRHSGRE